MIQMTLERPLGRSMAAILALLLVGLQPPAQAQSDFDRLFASEDPGPEGASERAADSMDTASEDESSDEQGLDQARGSEAPSAQAGPKADPAETIPVGQVEQVPAERAPRPRGRMVEEIVVTAQKREQAIEDVPISMSALTQDFLVEQGVTDVREALQLVPNAAIDSAGFFAAPRIRGFTLNNNNKSFEPPVGMVFDGVPQTRIPYFTAALFDVQRMEVLRGPQGTTFGKNTTAGLIHVISNSPTSDPEGFLSVDVGELSRRRVEAAYSSALSDNLNFRIAGLVDNRDGYIRNTSYPLIDTAPSALKDRARTAVRGILQAPQLWGASWEFAFEAFELYDGGAALEALNTGPNFRDAVRRYDPDADFIAGNWVHSQDYPDFRDSSIRSYRLKWERDFGNWSATALAAYSAMDQSLSLDTDFTPAVAIVGTGGDHSPVRYSEFRFTSPSFEGLFGLDFGSSTDFLVGLIYSKRQILDSDFIFGINNGPFFDLVGAAGADSGENGDSTVGGILGAPPVNPADSDDSYDEFAQEFDQTADAIALYAHTKWQISQAWGLELGARVTQEEKQGDWNVYFTTPPPNPSLEGVGVEEFQTTRNRREFGVQPKISLNWQPTDDFGAFLHAEQGFKGGGFNAFAFREGTQDVGFEDDDLEYEDELATNIGLDFKMTLFGGSAKLNVSLFRQTAVDFQVLIRENPPGTIGLGTSRVVNAEKALAQGIEADFLWLPTQWLTITASSGVLDTEFVKFSDGECAAGMGNTDGDENPRCDQSGKEFPFAPIFSNTLAMRVNFQLSNLPGFGRLGDGIMLGLGTLIEHEADQLLDVDLDERKRQDDFLRYRADVGIADPVRGWSLRLLGENLNNQVTHVRLGDVFANVIVGSQNQPRLWYLQFRQEF